MLFRVLSQRMGSNPATFDYGCAADIVIGKPKKLETKARGKLETKTRGKRMWDFGNNEEDLGIELGQ